MLARNSICSGRKSRWARSIWRKSVPGVDEQHRVLARGAGLGLVEEPQRHRQGDGVEEVGADRDHHVDRAGLDELLADLLLGVAGVASGVGHDEAGPALGVERRVELLDPQVVRVVGLGHAEGEPLVAGELVLLDLVDVERRVGHDVVEGTDGAVRVLVVAVGLPDVAGEAVQGEVHLRQRDGVLGLLRAEDRELAGGGLVVALDELRALHEHAARATRGVEDAALERLQDLDDEPDDRVGGEVLATALAFLGGEVGEEVLVDESERVAFELGRAAGRRAAATRSGSSGPASGSRAAGCP